MDLLSSIRKSGSRGGVNFSWDEVQTSQHRENYLGHSLMAPVGRWQKGKDLSWYAKGDDGPGANGETAEEKRVRERKEEIRRIKEAEEDALARALGLPVAERNVSGANAVSVGEVNRMVREVGVGEEEGGEGRGKGFGDFVGKVEGREGVKIEEEEEEEEKGGLVRKGRERDRERDGRRKDDERERRSSRERRHRSHRHRSRSGERRRHRSRSGDRHRRHGRDDREGREDRETRRSRRSRSPERRERRYRSRSPNGRTKGREERGRFVERPRRSRSPDSRDHRGRRYS